MKNLLSKETNSCGGAAQVLNIQFTFSSPDIKVWDLFNSKLFCFLEGKLQGEIVVSWRRCINSVLSL